MFGTKTFVFLFTDIYGKFRTFTENSGHLRKIPDIYGKFRTFTENSGHLRIIPDISGKFLVISGHLRIFPGIYVHSRTYPDKLLLVDTKM
jgi:hypothetical protein